MITQSIFNFLLELRENNNRDWFQVNRGKYDKAKKDFEIFVDIIIEQVKNIDPDISGIRAKDCIFRIFRDVRFSNDKRPYKTNFGAFLSKNGRKSVFPGYYVHIEPEQSFLGGGIYMPSSPILKAIRTEIYHNPEEFKRIINQEDFSTNFPEFYGEKLKSAPRGFPKEFADIELLQLKHYAVLKSISDKQVLTSSFVDEIRKTFEALYPLNRFLNHVIESAS